MDRESIAAKMKAHYEEVWRGGDAWNLEASQFEQQRYDHLLKLLSDRHYPRVLEIGCGSGGMTKRLASVAGKIVAIDIAEAAVERAKITLKDVDPGIVELKVVSALSYESPIEGPWDLIVLAETIYSIGWLYPFFDLGYFALRVRDGLVPGGRFLLANTYGGESNWLLHPVFIDTYRDLFRNVGLKIESEEIYSGIKDTVEMKILTTLFNKPKET